MRYFLIAGEASGDLHASNLMHEIKKQDPKAEFCFLGGDLMLAQGGVMVRHYREMAFMGFITVVKNLKKILTNLEDCKKAISDFRPDLVILTDYPDFNLQIAKFVKANYQTPVYYYIPPKIWAWKEYRIKKIKLYTDRIFTIFPFETAFYKKHNYEVDYVGNPTVDSIAMRPGTDETFETFSRRNNLQSKPVIALIPGSRRQEIANCLPKMMEAAGTFTDYQIVISGAPGIEPEYYQQFLKLNPVPVVFNQTYQLISQSVAAIVNSGTATLETALIGIPQVVVYHVFLGRLANLAKGIILKIKYISLVNLIADRELVKELIANHFTVGNVRLELDRLLNNNEYRNNMLKGYEDIKATLGEAGTAQRAAKKMVDSLNLIKRNY